MPAQTGRTVAVNGGGEGVWGKRPEIEKKRKEVDVKYMQILVAWPNKGLCVNHHLKWHV